VPVKVNRKEVIHQGRVIKLVGENVTLENGVTVDLDLIDHPGASAIVALKENRSVIMIQQYRHALGNFIWEIPAGTLDPRELPLNCAKRELVEETGFSADSWERLGMITPVPGYSNERIHLFLATDLSDSEQDLDQDEILKVHEIPLEQVMEMIHQGLIQDAKTISGIFFAAERLRKGN
jgi:ADP-ribose pyrophosphatase